MVNFKNVFILDHVEVEDLVDASWCFHPPLVHHHHHHPVVVVVVPEVEVGLRNDPPMPFQSTIVIYYNLNLDVTL